MHRTETVGMEFSPSSSSADDGMVTIASAPPTIDPGCRGVERCPRCRLVMSGSSSGVTWRSLAVQGGVLFFFLAGGALVFWALEGGRETSAKVRMESNETVDEAKDGGLAALARSHVVDIIRRVEDDNCTSNTDVIVKLRSLLDVVEKLDGKTPSSSSLSSSVSAWNWPGSIFFAITVVTTIGYGNLVPVTALGRTFTCLYALVGIPLCLVFLVNVGEKLNAATRPLDLKLRSLEPRLKGLEPRLKGLESYLARCLRAIVILTSGAIVFMVIPSLVFCYLQDWNLGTALYFSFISLSTIGFGDYVAGVQYSGPPRPVYRVLVGIWIFLGLAWLAGIVSSIQDTIQNLTKDVELIRPSSCRDKKNLTLLQRSEESGMRGRLTTPYAETALTDISILCNQIEENGSTALGENLRAEDNGVRTSALQPTRSDPRLSSDYDVIRL